ncbi:MAG: MFS transporter [Bacillota bacterium]|nr:MFS transporter [Bacillota bacterium]
MNSINKENIVVVNDEPIIISIKDKIITKFPALKYSNYRYFLFGQLVSLMGTWIQKTAQQWVIYQLTKSPFILGLVGVFQFTPLLLLSLLAGVLADRFPKKKFLIITQSVQMIQAFALAILLWSGHVRYWHILILAAVLGVANTFDMPTRQSFFIELVGKDALVSAIGLNSTIANVARIIGPTCAAIILSYFGAEMCFFINGLSFIAVLIGLLKIKTYSVVVRKKESNIFYEIIAGLKYVFSNKILANAVLSMLIIGTIAMNSDIIIPVFVKESLHKEVGGYSLLLSAMGVGSLFGSVYFTSKKGYKIESNSIIKFGVLLGMFLALTGIFHNYYLSFITVAGIGAFSMILMASINSIIQLNSVDEFRGRAMSLYSLVLMGTTPIGNLFTGIIDEHLGPNECFIIIGLSTVLLILFISTNKKQIEKK